MGSIPVNRATVDVYCLKNGATNDANEVERVEAIRFRSVGGTLRALNGRELERAQQIRADIRWEFTCRQPNIEPDNWLCERGRDRKLNVVAAMPTNGQETQFKILCSERV